MNFVKQSTELCCERLIEDSSNNENVNEIEFGFVFSHRNHRFFLSLFWSNLMETFCDNFSFFHILSGVSIDVVRN